MSRLLMCAGLLLMFAMHGGADSLAWLMGCCIASVVCSDPLAEIRKKLTLPQAAAEADVSLSTIWRWMLRGSSGIKLTSFVVGRKRYTTKERLEQFLREINAAANGETAGEPTNSAEVRRRRQEVAAADAELAGEGL